MAALKDHHSLYRVFPSRLMDSKGKIRHTHSRRPRTSCPNHPDRAQAPFHIPGQDPRERGARNACRKDHWRSPAFNQLFQLRRIKLLDTSVCMIFPALAISWWRVNGAAHGAKLHAQFHFPCAPDADPRQRRRNHHHDGQQRDAQGHLYERETLAAPSGRRLQRGGGRTNALRRILPTWVAR